MKINQPTIGRGVQRINHPSIASTVSGTIGDNFYDYSTVAPSFTNGVPFAVTTDAGAVTLSNVVSSFFTTSTGAMSVLSLSSTTLLYLYISFTFSTAPVCAFYQVAIPYTNGISIFGYSALNNTLGTIVPLSAVIVNGGSLGTSAIQLATIPSGSAIGGNGTIVNFSGLVLVQS